ncbi:MAG: response regulator [Paracoccaceae bacterium]
MKTLLKILHVDDDDDIREVTLLALEALGGLDVTQCSSGSEALAVVQSVVPDLFLLDVMMPDLTGEETLRALREIPQFVQTPAIFMTAKSQRSDLKRLMDMGALDVIQKPFDVTTLSSRITEMWARRPRH